MEPRQCATCGAELAADAPNGLCPACRSKAHADDHSAGKLADTAPFGSRFSAPKPEELARYFPQLEIIELLAQGGMGAVYKARQPALDRLVAVKILPTEVAGDPGFAERFTREARALARLNHPNIVGIYDFGQADGLFYFVMEYVEGASLRQLVSNRQLTPRQALALVPQICEALQFAHDEGIVHRDIKPENILIDKRGRVKVADFGLARLLGHSADEATLTRVEQVMGTPLYMAPEQMQGSHAVDHRADIYSLGVVFYEMLTGELPMGRFPPPSQKVEVDVRLDEVVLRALEREPDRRYQHASDVKTDVESIVRRAAPSAAPPTNADEVSQTGTTTRRQPGEDADTRSRFSARQALHDGFDSVTSSFPCPAQVQGPAIGVLIVGIFVFVGMAFGSLLAFDELAQRHNFNMYAKIAFVAASSLVLAPSMGVILAAWKMLHCRAYWLAIVASLLLIVTGPLTVIGLPVGIWALLVLSRRDVRAAFSAVRNARQNARRADREPIRRVQPVASRRTDGEPLALPSPGGNQAVASAFVTIRSQVRAPAIGLLVTAILNWIALPFWVTVAYFFSRVRLLPVDEALQAAQFAILDLPLISFIAVPAVMLMAGVLILVAALKMMRCQGYSLAVFGSILAMLIIPGNIVGLPIGILALVVLTQRDVKAAFPYRVKRHRSLGERIAFVTLSVLLLAALVRISVSFLGR